MYLVSNNIWKYHCYAMRPSVIFKSFGIGYFSSSLLFFIIWLLSVEELPWGKIHSITSSAICLVFRYFNVKCRNGTRQYETKNNKEEVGRKLHFDDKRKRYNTIVVICAPKAKKKGNIFRPILHVFLQFIFRTRTRIQSHQKPSHTIVLSTEYDEKNKQQTKGIIEIDNNINKSERSMLDAFSAHQTNLNK